MTPHGPPRLAERLLAAVIPDPAWRETVVGDFHEEYVDRACRVGAVRASLWYWWVALRLSIDFDQRRTAAPRHPGRARFLGDTLMQDLRQAFRMLVKQRGLTAAVVVALAFGLGANSAIFSFIDALLLRPLTFAGADRVALIGTMSPQRDDKMESVTPADFLDWRREAGAFAARVRLRALLAGAQIALAVALLSASLLSVAAARRAMFGPQGYDPDGVLTASLVLPDGAYEAADTRRQFVQRVLADLQAAPGVQSAAVTNILPSGGNNTTTIVHPEGAEERPEDPRLADLRSVSAPYFATMRIPLLHGRPLAATDREDSLPVAVVSESFAQRHWPGGDAVGRRLRMGNGPTWVTVVGVCGDVVHDWFRQRRAPTLYRPFAQAPRTNQVFVLRASGNPAALAPAIRSAVRRADTYQPINQLRTMRTVLSERAIGLSHAAWLLSILGGMALLLSALAIYSVMAYLTSRRTQEFGLRIALGATRHDVVGLTIRQVARVTGGGVLAGLVAAAALGRLMQGVMFGAVSFDPVLVVAPALALALVALAAGYIPARRAARVDPMVALRAE